jgi:hypothetical protein
MSCFRGRSVGRLLWGSSDTCWVSGTGMQQVESRFISETRLSIEEVSGNGGKWCPLPLRRGNPTCRRACSSAGSGFFFFFFFSFVLLLPHFSVPCGKCVKFKSYWLKCARKFSSVEGSHRMQPNAIQSARQWNTEPSGECGFFGHQRNRFSNKQTWNGYFNFVLNLKSCYVIEPGVRFSLVVKVLC